MKIVIIIIILLGLNACSVLDAKHSNPPISKKSAVNINPSADKTIVKQPVSKSIIAQPVVSNYTTIYNNVEYYFDPTITVQFGEAVIALYTIDESKKRVYKFIPKKDLTSPLILNRH